MAADLVYMSIPAAPDPGFSAALFAAKRRNKREYGRVGLMQRALSHKNEFIIFLWNQG